MNRLQSWRWSLTNGYWLKLWSMGHETTYKPLPSQSGTDHVISGQPCRAHHHPRELHPTPFTLHLTKQQQQKITLTPEMQSTWEHSRKHKAARSLARGNEVPEASAHLFLPTYPQSIRWRHHSPVSVPNSGTAYNTWQEGVKSLKRLPSVLCCFSELSLLPFPLDVSLICQLSHQLRAARATAIAEQSQLIKSCLGCSITVPLLQRGPKDKTNWNQRWK